MLSFQILDLPFGDWELFKMLILNLRELEANVPLNVPALTGMYPNNLIIYTNKTRTYLYFLINFIIKRLCNLFLVITQSKFIKTPFTVITDKGSESETDTVKPRSGIEHQRSRPSNVEKQVKKNKYT